MKFISSSVSRNIAVGSSISLNVDFALVGVLRMDRLILPAGVRKHAGEQGVTMAILLRGFNDDTSISKNRCLVVEPPVHGKPTQRSESVAGCISAMRVGKSEAKIREFVESSVYRSRVTAPLGKSQRREFSLPPPQHSYGKALKNDGSISDAFAGSSDRENHIIHELYKKSHHAFYPGEQIDRKYNWPKAITHNFEFGARDTKSEPINLSLKWFSASQDQVSETTEAINS